MKDGLRPPMDSLILVSRHTAQYQRWLMARCVGVFSLAALPLAVAWRRAVSPAPASIPLLVSPLVLLRCLIRHFLLHGCAFSVSFGTVPATDALFPATPDSPTTSYNLDNPLSWILHTVWRRTSTFHTPPHYHGRAERRTAHEPLPRLPTIHRRDGGRLPAMAEEIRLRLVDVPLILPRFVTPHHLHPTTTTHSAFLPC